MRPAPRFGAKLLSFTICLDRTLSGLRRLSSACAHLDDSKSSARKLIATAWGFMMGQRARARVLFSVTLVCLGSERSQANEGWHCTLTPGNYQLSLNISGNKLVNNVIGTPPSIIVENTEERIFAFRQSWIDHVPSGTVYIITKSSGKILEISNVAAAAAGESISGLGPTLNKGGCSKE